MSRGDEVQIRNEQDAIAAFVALLGSIPKGNHVSATKLELAMFGGDTDECLWRVGLVLDDEDDIGSMAPMGLTILGPDGKAWWMSGSWLYDPEIWQKALAHLYIEGVADLVDPDELAHHVGLITEQRNNAIVALPDAARRGELRWVPKEDAVTAIWPPNRRVGALFSTAVVREDEREVLKGASSSSTDRVTSWVMKE